MPFTPSHVAAILPLARTPLAPAALALGSMAPDIPYFLPLGIPRTWTHSLAGLPTIDLALGAVAFTVWVLVLRAPVLDYSPVWLRERMAPRPRWRVGKPGGDEAAGHPEGRLGERVLSALLVVLALEIGTVTHLALDQLTHEGGWLDRMAPWSGIEVGPFAVANIIHAIVSIVLGVVLAQWIRRWAQRTAREPRPGRVGGRERVGTWLGLLGVLAVVGTAWWLVPALGGATVRHRSLLDPNLLGHAFFVAVAVSGAVALTLALLWHARKVR